MKKIKHKRSNNNTAASDAKTLTEAADKLAEAPKLGAADLHTEDGKAATPPKRTRLST